jgi:hypothetical protein
MAIASVGKEGRPGAAIGVVHFKCPEKELRVSAARSRRRNLVGLNAVRETELVGQLWNFQANGEAVEIGTRL